MLKCLYLVKYFCRKTVPIYQKVQVLRQQGCGTFQPTLAADILYATLQHVYI